MEESLFRARNIVLDAAIELYVHPIMHYLVILIITSLQWQI